MLDVIDDVNFKASWGGQHLPTLIVSEKKKHQEPGMPTKKSEMFKTNTKNQCKNIVHQMFYLG